MLTADQECLGHMRDFMRTIERLRTPDMDMDKELLAFLAENMREVQLLKSKMMEATQATEAQGQRLLDALREDEELSQMGIGQPSVWSPDP